MQARRPQPGFTLIELILVMVIIAAMLAIVAPSLGRMRSRTRIDDSASQLRSMIELARARAVADGRPTRVVIDSAASTCWIEQLEGGGFVRPLASYGKKIELDTGVQITSVDALSEVDAVYTVRAEPDGRVQVVQLSLVSTASGRERVVFTRSLTEPYRVGDAEDAAAFDQGGADAL